MKALRGGKVLNGEYQRIWQDSAQIIDPANSYNWYGYGIDQLRWGPNTYAFSPLAPQASVEVTP